MNSEPRPSAPTGLALAHPKPFLNASHCGSYLNKKPRIFFSGEHLEPVKKRKGYLRDVSDENGVTVSTI
jgi:hypothetical protein